MSQIHNPKTPRTFNRGTSIDTHAWLVSQINKPDKAPSAFIDEYVNQNTDNTQNVKNNATTVSSTAVASIQENGGSSLLGNIGVEDIYLYFDSINKTKSSNTSSGEIKFYITTINNASPIDGCIEIHIDSFYLPMVFNAATDPDFFFFRRVYMFISNLSSTQSVLGANSMRYHFEFEVTTLTSIAVKLEPLRDSIYFRNPVTTLTDFNVQFFVPNGKGGFNIIPLPKDTLTVQAVPGTNPAQFTILTGDNVTSFLQPLPALPNVLAIPVAVYFSGFTSANATINTAVANSAGMFVTTLIDNVTFSIATLDFTALAPGTYTMSCFIAKNRVAIPVRFTSIKNNPTNYLLPTHI